MTATFRKFTANILTGICTLLLAQCSLFEPNFDTRLYPAVSVETFDPALWDQSASMLRQKGYRVNHDERADAILSIRIDEVNYACLNKYDSPCRDKDKYGHYPGFEARASATLCSRYGGELWSSSSVAYHRNRLGAINKSAQNTLSGIPSYGEYPGMYSENKNAQKQ